VAKTALINKANGKPKFKVRAYTRCQRCGRPHSVYRKFGLCRVCLREMAHRGELPGVTRAAGKAISTYQKSFYTEGRPPHQAGYETAVREGGEAQ